MYYSTSPRPPGHFWIRLLQPALYQPVVVQQLIPIFFAGTGKAVSKICESHETDVGDITAGMVATTKVVNHHSSRKILRRGRCNTYRRHQPPLQQQSSFIIFFKI